MNILLTVGLPISLAFIMLSLGLGLTGADFARVIRMPRAFFLGAFAQVILLPVVAFGLLAIFDLPPGLAFGVMILAFCPGGVTSNMLSRLAHGDVALSVSLTAVVSLLSVVTVPPLVAFSFGYFMGDEATPVDVTELAIAMFVITALPVGLGMLIRRFAPGFTDRVEGAAFKIAAILFVVIVIAALASSWSEFTDNIGQLGPILAALMVILMSLAYGLARVGGLGTAQSRTISIEGGLQNGTLGITLAALIAGAEGINEFALPSALYGIVMYSISLPVIFGLMRSTPED